MTFNEWAVKKMREGHDIVAVKRDPKDGETYEDGTQVKNPVNAGWKDTVTGEMFWLDGE